MKKNIIALILLLIIISLTLTLYYYVKGEDPTGLFIKDKKIEDPIYIKKVKINEAEIPNPIVDEESFESPLISNVRIGKMPILTYHYFQTEPSKNYAVVTGEEFEAMIVKLKSLGYTFIDARDLKEAIYNTGELPEKAAMISIDDGYRNNYDIAFPILKKHNVKATIFVVGSYMGKEDRFLTWDMIKEMSDSGLVDIENHTYNMHSYQDETDKKIPKMAYKYSYESDEDYLERITDDLIKNNLIIEKYTGKKPVAISYPGGFWNDIIQKACVESGILMGFVGANDNNFDMNSSSIYRIKRYNIYPNQDLNKFVEKIK